MVLSNGEWLPCFEKIFVLMCLLYQSSKLNPWSLLCVGIPINYFSVGLIYAGSVSILYPILVIQYGVTSAFISAAVNLVTLFWSYKIVLVF